MKLAPNQHAIDVFRCGSHALRDGRHFVLKSVVGAADHRPLHNKAPAPISAGALSENNGIEMTAMTKHPLWTNVYWRHISLSILIEMNKVSYRKKTLNVRKCTQQHVNFTGLDFLRGTEA
jgi:hypothetical protein